MNITNYKYMFIIIEKKKKKKKKKTWLSIYPKRSTISIYTALLLCTKNTTVKGVYIWNYTHFTNLFFYTFLFFLFFFLAFYFL